MEQIDRNVIRNVLMNEMGVTRETIRAELTSIVADTARTYLSTLFQTGFLEKIVTREVEKLLEPEGPQPFYEMPIKQVVREIARERIGKLVDEHIKIEVQK